jgi:uncharacterized protein YkwD
MPQQSNSAKLGQALAFAAVAGAAQVALTAAEQHARNSAPVRRSTAGTIVSSECENEGQYACLTVATAPSAPSAPEPEMTEQEAHEYVLAYVNGVRKLNGAGPVASDAWLDAFAHSGSDELAQDHLPSQHMIDHAREIRAGGAELQGAPEGARPGPLQDRIADYLLRWMAEGPGELHHDTLLLPDWHKLGIGIVVSGGRLYLTVDFSR